MNAKTELKPCPFCGTQTDESYHVSLRSHDDVINGGNIGYEIFCPCCGISMHEEYLSDLLERWNTRPAPAVEVKPLELEAAAKIIYERAMRYLRLDVPEWVDGGNSLAQDEARAIAAALSPQPPLSPQEAAGDFAADAVEILQVAIDNWNELHPGEPDEIFTDLQKRARAIAGGSDHD